MCEKRTIPSLLRIAMLLAATATAFSAAGCNSSYFSSDPQLDGIPAAVEVNPNARRAPGSYPWWNDRENMKRDSSQLNGDFGTTTRNW